MSTAIALMTAAQARAARVRPKVGGFPYLAEVFRQAGVTNCYYTVPSMTALYITTSGSVVQQDKPIVTEMVDVPGFNEANLVAAINVDKAGDCTFTEFVEALWRAGATGYQIDFVARTCTYFGVAGERYLESYNEVDLPVEPAPSPVEPATLEPSTLGSHPPPPLPKPAD